MTSREALKHITKDDFNMIITTYPPKPAYNGLTKEDMISIIKRDLEVLEIIKKHSFLDLSVLADYDNSEFDKYFDDWHDTTNELDRKEFELLKEWLRNE